MYLIDIDKEPFEVDDEWFNSMQLILMLLPNDCILYLLSSLDEMETSGIRQMFLARDSSMCLNEECYTLRLTAACVIYRNIEQPLLGKMVKLAFARHCLGKSQSLIGRYHIPITFCSCLTIENDVVKKFDEVMNKFQHKCKSTESVTLTNFSPFAAQYARLFFNECSDNIKQMCSTNGEVDKKIAEYHKKNKKVLESIKRMQDHLSRYDTSKRMDSNLLPGTLAMYRAVIQTLPYSYIEKICRQMGCVENVGLQMQASKRQAIEYMLDSFLLSIAKPEVRDNLDALHQCITYFLKQYMHSYFIFLSTGRVVEDNEEEDELATIQSQETHDIPQYEMEFIRKKGIDPWNPPLETHILLETRHSYPRAFGAVNMEQLNEMFSPRFWGNKSAYMCNRKKINELMRLTVEFCTHAVKYNPVKGVTEGCREKRNVLRGLLNRCNKTLSTALSIALPYEVIRPFHLSPAIVIRECSSHLNIQEIGQEVYNACLLLIMLSAVRNVVFVPSTETEGNTVIVTGSAITTYVMNPRDMNICMVSIFFL